MRAELDQHLELEERVLLPACRGLEASNETSASVDPGVLVLLEHEHAETGDALAALRELADDYDPDRAPCGTHRAPLSTLRRLELDLHRHVHEENNVLFPRVLARALAEAPGRHSGSAWPAAALAARARMNSRSPSRFR
jgi:regulator of cell morphogenesis and NO signaling